ncbi:hypothetical protein STEG23_017669, partial [Scotinomys teguina]
QTLGVTYDMKEKLSVLDGPLKPDFPASGEGCPTLRVVKSLVCHQLLGDDLDAL